MNRDETLKNLEKLLKASNCTMIDMSPFQDTIESAIKYINRCKKYRKESKRWKRKYTELKMEVKRNESNNTES